MRVFVFIKVKLNLLLVSETLKQLEINSDAQIADLLEPIVYITDHIQ